MPSRKPNLDPLSRLAARDIRRMMAGAKNPDDAKAILEKRLPRLIVIYGMAAASLAANWFDDARAVAGARGSFRAVVPPLPEELGVEELAGWGLGSVYREKPDWEAATTLVSGGAQRRIIAPAIAALILSTALDPAAKGYTRSTDATACQFCADLADGTIYSGDSADFESHDNCHCSPSPVWTW